MFPDGAPGVGLVLLRTMAGAALLFFGSISWIEQHELKMLILAAVSVGCGLFFFLGLFSSFVCTLGAFISLETFLWSTPVPVLNDLTTKLVAAFTAVIAIALLCLGPGAYSLDARRCGHREIIIPPRPRPSDGGPL